MGDVVIGCAVSADLARYEAEQDRLYVTDMLAERIVVENRDAVAKKLLALKGWIADEVTRGVDTMADLAQAIDYACRGDHVQAAQLLCKAFESAAQETARELLSEAADDYIEECGRLPRGYEPPSEPDADSVDLARWEGWE